MIVFFRRLPDGTTDVGRSGMIGINKKRDVVHPFFIDWFFALRFLFKSVFESLYFLPRTACKVGYFYGDASVGY